MEAWLLSVRGLVSDQGVESSLADAPNVLPCFFHYMKHGIFDASLIDNTSYLFPRGLWIPGWHHQWVFMKCLSVHPCCSLATCACPCDIAGARCGVELAGHGLAFFMPQAGLLKDACERFPWWPHFLLLLRACVKLLKIPNVREAIEHALPWSQAEKFALRAPTASFAHWRWDTLLSTCTFVRNLEFLVSRWDAVLEVIRVCKEGATLGSVKEAFVVKLASPERHRRWQNSQITPATD